MPTQRILFFLANIILFSYCAFILPSSRIVNYEEEDIVPMRILTGMVNLSTPTVATTPTTSSLPSVSQPPVAVQSSLAPIVTSSNTPTLTRPKTAPEAMVHVSVTNGLCRHLDGYLKKLIYQEALLRIIDKGDLFEKINKQEQILTERMAKIPQLRKLLETNKLNYDELLFYTCQTGDKSFLLDLPPHGLSNPSPTKPLESDGKVIDEVNPLQMAIAFGQTDIARLLITSKANINAKSKNNITALEYAINYGKKDIENLLRHEMALNSTIGTSVTPTTNTSIRLSENGITVPVHASNNNPTGQYRATQSAQGVYSTVAPTIPAGSPPSGYSITPSTAYSVTPRSSLLPTGPYITRTPQAPPAPPGTPMSSLLPAGTQRHFSAPSAPTPMAPSHQIPDAQAAQNTYAYRITPTPVRYTNTTQGTLAGQTTITTGTTTYIDPANGTSFHLPSNYTLTRYSPAVTMTSPGTLPTSAQPHATSQMSIGTPSSSLAPSSAIATSTPAGLAQPYQHYAQPYTAPGSSISVLPSANIGQKRTSQDAQLNEKLREAALKARSENNKDSDDDDDNDKTTDNSSSINNEPINAFNNRIYNEALMQIYNFRAKGTGSAQILIDQAIYSINKSLHEKIWKLKLLPANAFLNRVLYGRGDISFYERMLIYTCLFGDISFLPDMAVPTIYESLCLPYTHPTKGNILSIEPRKLLNLLQLAVIEGHENIVSLLIKSKYNPKIKTESGLTLLHLAYCHLDKPGLIKLLIDNGVDPNERCSSGNTILHYHIAYFVEGASKITQQCIDILLSAGLDINTKNLHGRTPLLTAFWQPSFNVNSDANIKILLENGADVKGLPEPDHPNFHSKIGVNLQVLLHGYKFISKSPINVTILDPSQVNAGKRFMEFAFRGDLEEIKSLIAGKKISKNSVSEMTHEGYSALHFAAARNHHELLDYLLNLSNMNLNRKIFNANRLNKDGETALHSAAKSNAIDAIKVLLASRNITDVEILNHKGENALDIAYRLNCPEAVNELIRPIQRPREIFLSQYISSIDIVKLISSYIYVLNTKSAKR